MSIAIHPSAATAQMPMYLLTAQPELGTNVLADPQRRKEMTDELRALPFLGSVSCSRRALIAGEVDEIIVDYEVGASGLADSGWIKLCFKYYSDWDFQTDRPDGRDYASVEYRTGSLLGGAFPESRSTLNSLKMRYDVKGGERPFQKALLVDLEDGFLRPGDHIIFRLGDRRAGGPGTRVQTFVEDRFTFRVMVDPLGTSRMAYAADFGMDILPGPAEKLVVAGPRLVRVGEPFKLKVHAEDLWGNTAVDVEGSLRVSFSETIETINVPLPQRGWASVEVPLRLDKPGEVGVRTTLEGSTTAPVLEGQAFVDADSDLPFPRAFYGDLHVHSNDTVGTNDNAYNFTYGRRIGALDFLGYTANDFQITDARWEAVVKLAREVTEEGQFLCFPGVEWCGTPGVGGDHNVVFLGDDTTLARCLEWHEDTKGGRPQPQHWPISMLYEAYEKHPEDYLLIPHVGGRRAILDWHHPQLERLIEVHSAWGPNDWFFEDAMRRGLRLGATGASDEHRGRPGSGHPGANIFGAAGGLCGLMAPALSCREVGQALRQRHTWATTGARLVALLHCGKHWMGDELTAHEPVEASYLLLSDAGWEQVSVHDGAGLLEVRNLHQELGFSEHRIRLRWGGARIKDRYRWASWSGRFSLRDTFIDDYEPWALEHPEKYVRRAGPLGIEWEGDTYGRF